MIDLVQEVPNEDTQRPLSPDEVKRLALPLLGWDTNEETQSLERKYQFADFSEALSFANHVGDIAEIYSHHPTLITTWGETKVMWKTHSINGISESDIIMAAKTDDIFERWESIQGNKDIVQIRSEDSFPASDPPPVGSRIE